jgi:hypothetical protein
MLYRTLPLLVAALVLTLLVSSPALAADKTHEGIVVKAGAAKLTMTDKDGGNKQTHNVASDAKITCDGKECKLEDLKEGCSVKVTTDDAKKVATKIEATSKKDKK